MVGTFYTPDELAGLLKVTPPVVSNWLLPDAATPYVSRAL